MQKFAHNTPQVRRLQVKNVLSNLKFNDEDNLEGKEENDLNIKVFIK